jgi:hypothetical protein
MRFILTEISIVNEGDEYLWKVRAKPENFIKILDRIGFCYYFKASILPQTLVCFCAKMFGAFKNLTLYFL